jgi:carbon-monoxide dehydrogenase small subunit
MLLTAAELLRGNPSPTREDVRDWISGNFCRCTGYQSIVDAVMEAAS